MKKIILIAIAFISLQAIAQDKRHRDSKEGRKGNMEMMKDLSAEDIATLQSKKMTLALDLSEKQQIQVKDILFKQATVRKQKMEEHKKKKTSDDAKKPSKEERVKMMNERLDNKIEMKKQLKSILTAEQFEKWKKMQGRRHMKNKGQEKRRTKH
ncbi:hypothetical protein A9Q86_11075 [Flavobacteriales bacterium 33_180_T64]|nr:hypothetical protein A9Q86_11075 [Flavobacteriales bacterium 33_180_T64]